MAPPVFGFTGWSGCGKTTLLTAVLARLVARGLGVSTIKHTHHEVDLDQPGKDSWRHRQAGAREVMLASGRRWALLHEVVGEAPELPALLGRLGPCDLVLVEGFKADPHPKIEIHRPVLGRPPLWPGREDIVAIATDAPLRADRPVLELGDAAAIAGWMVGFLGLPP